MIKTVSRTQIISDQLKNEGKVVYLDKPEHIAKIIAMNEEMADVRREYQVKDRNSQNSAVNVILTS